MEHQIFSFAEMILLILALLFRGRRSTEYCGQMDRKTHKTYWQEAASSVVLKEVSQNCFVFDVVNFRHGESLTEFRRFGAVRFHFFKGLAELLRF